MIRTRNEGSKIIISVEDNGIGIKKEDVKRYLTDFIAFPRKHSRCERFGLGLAYVKKIVTDLGGSIRAESELERNKIYNKFTRYNTKMIWKKN